MARRLRLLLHVHAYPPRHNAGAEWMAHAILKDLVEHHSIDAAVVVSRPPRRRDRFDDIPVEMVRDPNRLGVFYNWADVVVTHLDATAIAVRTARRYGKPLVHVVHNHAQLDFWKVTAAQAQLVVANSEWIDRVLVDYPNRTTVYPPVWVDDYRLDESGPPSKPVVALLNLTEAKGAPTFYSIARRMPDVHFLGVTGSYGAQVPKPSGLDNVEILRNQPDVRRVYRRASIVVMPSTYESWGRVAVEAAAAGRPVIAAPTPGLRETQIPWRFISHRRYVDWVSTIRKLLDPPVWNVASRQGYDRAVTLEAISRGQLAELADRLEALRSWEPPPPERTLPGAPVRRAPARRVH